MNRKFLSLLSLGLILLILLSVITQGEEITFEERIITFTQSSRLDRSIVLDIPKDAKITEFQFEITGPIEPGPEQPGRHHPRRVLDLPQHRRLDRRRALGTGLGR